MLVSQLEQRQAVGAEDCGPRCGVKGLLGAPTVTPTDQPASRSAQENQIDLGVCRCENFRGIQSADVSVIALVPLAVCFDHCSVVSAV